MAIAMGLRLPKIQRLQVVDQQCRTIDAMKRYAINIVFDVGANRGFYAKHLRMLGYDGRILSFEPDPETFKHLKEMASGDAKWQVFNCALGESPGEMNFNVIHTGKETVLSSALEPLSDWAATTINVPVRTVEEVFQSECKSDDARIFLKMDTQGYDLNVFKGAANLPSISLLQSEVSVIPLYKNMPHYTEALLYYEGAGFELLGLFVVNRTPSGGILEYDALMGRHSS